MKIRAGRSILILGVLVVLAVIPALYFLRSGSAGAIQTPLPDTGKFKAGSARGSERAGFSGRPLVLVFADPEAVDWPALAACLQSPEVEAEISAFFTAVLVDARLEPEIEEVLRERDGLQVVVRELSGAFLGGLPQGFQCSALVEFLSMVRKRSITAPEKSPIYAALLDSASPIDDLIQKGEAEKADKFVEFLKEFEGENSSVALRAQARLGQ